MKDDEKPEKRTGARFITELTVVLSRAENFEETLDDHATAHDISVEGFRVQTQTVLLLNQVIHFALELFDGQKASGEGRVAWLKQETLALWAGITIEHMPRADRRRLRRMLHPNEVDWLHISETAFTTAFVVIVSLALQRLIFHRPELHREALKLGAGALAAFVFVWALRLAMRR